MDQKQLLKEKTGFLPHFSYDLNRLTVFTGKMGENRQILQQGCPEEKEKVRKELSYLLTLGAKWKTYPEWQLCLRGPLREIRQLKRCLPPENVSPGDISLEKKIQQHFTPQETPPVMARKSTAPAPLIDGKEQTDGKEQSRTIRRVGNDGIEQHFFSSEDVDHFYENNDFVGEKSIRTLLLYAALGKAHVGIESLSGAGKSALLYTFLRALPSGSFCLLKRSTDKALFNDPDINDYTFLVFTELQKVPDGLKEDIKDIAEGVDSTYRRTNRDKNGIDLLTISAGKVVIYTLAITNDYFKRKDNELSRRFIVLPTDISQEQNLAVVEAYAEKDFLDAPVASHPQFARHIKDCLALDYELKNPFLSFLAKNQPEEITGNVRYRSFVKHIQKLVKGCALFHHHSRAINEGSIIASADDNRQVMELYGQLFYDNVVGISVVDRLVLNSLEIGKEYPEPEAVELIAEKGFYDKTTIIKDSFQNLHDLRFVQMKNGRVEKIRDRSAYQELNWEEALSAADQLMKEHYPQLREEWHQQCLPHYNKGLS